MRTSKVSLASKTCILSMLAGAFLVAPQSGEAFPGFDPDPGPMEEIVVIGKRPPPRDAQLNRLIAEQAAMEAAAELQRLLSQTQAEIIRIDDEIDKKEDEVEKRCRTVRDLVDEGTASCVEVAQALNYVCLGGAVALGGLSSGTAGGVAALACTVAYDDSIARCEANPGGGIPDTLGDRIDQYCPDAR